jgi:hypothetical protein
MENSPCSDKVLPCSSYPRRFYLRKKKRKAMEKIVRSNSKVDAGTACMDSANKVEPCPNVRIVQPAGNGDSSAALRSE